MRIIHKKHHQLTRSHKHLIMKEVETFNYKNLAITATLVLLALIGGFLTGQATAKKTKPSSTPATNNERISPALSPLFRNVTATIQGQVISVSNNKITVKDRQDKTDSLELSPRVLIYKYNSSGTPASPSADLKSIQTNQDAIIVAELYKDSYQVVSISYLPKPPIPTQK